MTGSTPFNINHNQNRYCHQQWLCLFVTFAGLVMLMSICDSLAAADDAHTIDSATDITPLSRRASLSTYLKKALRSLDHYLSYCSFLVSSRASRVVSWVTRGRYSWNTTVKQISCGDQNESLVTAPLDHNETFSADGDNEYEYVDEEDDEESRWPDLGTPIKWADTPIPLIPTPIFEDEERAGVSETKTLAEKEDTQNVDIFTKGGSHMALLHNSILRGFNAIYLQAPAVEPVDIHSFVGFSLTWCKFVEKHVEDEEGDLWGKIEAALQHPGALDDMRSEHAASMGGIRAFHALLESLSSLSPNDAVEKFNNGTSFITIMDQFKEPFAHHVHSEIKKFVDFSKFPLPPGDTVQALGMRLSPVFATWGRNSVAEAGKGDVVPFLFFHFDRTAEKGRWINWPPIPRSVYWGLVHFGGWFHRDWWRFAASDTEGMPKPLYALERQRERHLNEREQYRLERGNGARKVRRRKSHSEETGMNSSSSNSSSRGDATPRRWMRPLRSVKNVTQSFFERFKGMSVLWPFGKKGLRGPERGSDSAVRG